ncbi:MAG: C_GCAxxG_C_C family protein [Candidatus Bathyarchaeota archaeon]|nr:MAG: C_GCAxxG_C_C family protein [Candidatus Bathyarchaeota archaeon]
MSEEKLIKEIRRKAHLYDQYSGCSQSVLLALQEGLGIGDGESFKSATVLSGGVARRGETCWALLGAHMALGLVYGRERMEDTPSYKRAMTAADEICDGFQRKLWEEFGFDEPLSSTLCSEIQSKIYGRSFNLRDSVELEAFLEAGGHSDEGCYKVCGIAAEVATRRLLELKGD